MGEKSIETRLREMVKKMGGLAIKFFVLSFAGFPDRIILLPGGRIYFAEIKSTGDKPKPRQRIVHDMLRKLGFTVFVIDSKETLNFVLDFINPANDI